MAGKEKNNIKESKGFAGLSSLVSEVDTSLPPPAKLEAENSGDSSNAKHLTASENLQPEPQPNQKQPHQAPTQPSSTPSTVKWLLGIAAVIGVFWLISELNKNSPSSPSASYTPFAQRQDQHLQSNSPSSRFDFDAWDKELQGSSPPSQFDPSTARPVEKQVPPRPEEAKPPVGQDRVLSTEQLRYCLAEDIRMEGAKSALNKYNNLEVKRFNSMVDDYNSRCGRFRYHNGTLEIASRDIEPYRIQLQEEGISRFARASSSETVLSPDVSRSERDATVKSIQQILNNIGYSAGTPDGLMGKNTRSAIIAFQKDKNLVANGIADEELLNHLQQVLSSLNENPAEDEVPAERYSASSSASPLNSGFPANAWVSGSNWYCKDGYKKVGDSCEKLNVPRNAWVSGSNWYCKDGFRKVGDQCEAINVPANAWVSGSNWYCKDGYKKVGEGCEKFNVPPNAWVSGSNWYCKDGFRKVGDQCEAINIPDNAWVSGSNWYCKDGYKKVGEKCVSINAR